MTAKIDKGRQVAFLRALSETGNLTLSAERAGVSRSWPRLQRKADAGFDADYLAALAKAGRRLDRQEDNRAAQGWREAGDAELIVVGPKGGGGSCAAGRARGRRSRSADSSPRCARRTTSSSPASARG